MVEPKEVRAEPFRLHWLLWHRMSAWLWISIALLSAVRYFAPHMIGVALYKLTLITIGGYLGYVLSLAVEGALGITNRRRRPHEYRALAREHRLAAESKTAAAKAEGLARAWELDQQANQMLMRRAIVVAAVLIASALGS